MKTVCERHGALLILDEVMSGIGRTGTFHAWQSPLVGVAPDIQTIGKGLGGGYVPIAAVLVNARVVDAMAKGSGSFSHGQTYQGHPIACAAALEVIRTIKEEKLVKNVEAMGVLMERLLKEQVAELPFVGNVRGNGLFWGVSVKERAVLSTADTNRSSSSRTRKPNNHSNQVMALRWVFTNLVRSLLC